MAGLAEGVGDEGCIEPSSQPGPERDPFWQGRVQPAKHERDPCIEGRPVERVDERFISIWGRRLVGGREGFLDLFVI